MNNQNNVQLVCNVNKFGNQIIYTCVNTNTPVVNTQAFGNCDTNLNTEKFITKYRPRQKTDGFGNYDTNIDNRIRRLEDMVENNYNIEPFGVKAWAKKQETL